MIFFSDVITKNTYWPHIGQPNAIIAHIASARRKVSDEPAKHASFTKTFTTVASCAQRSQFMILKSRKYELKFFRYARLFEINEFRK